MTLADKGQSITDDMTLDVPTWLQGEPRRRIRPIDVWQREYLRMVVLVDFAIILGSTLLALHLRFGDEQKAIHGLSYALLSILLVPVWLAALVLARAYEARFLGTGADEFKRVSSASLRLMAVMAIVAYTFQLNLARGYVAVALPLGTLLLLTGRYGQRRWLHARRRRGKSLHRAIVVGGVDGIYDLATQLEDFPYVGYSLVGACLPSSSEAFALPGVPVLGSLTQVMAAVAQANADSVIVTAGPGMSPAVLRRLSWEIEGTGISLVVAPALLDVAGPRISVRPVAGLPLLHVEEPELAGARQAVKAIVEWLFATIAFLLLLPLMVGIAVLIRIDSHGPPLFRQTRVGKAGREFTVYKMRTMRADAESLLESLREQNEASDGLLFKMREDPRITRVGKYLRKWSIDELPQLWNVVRGDMALVGPRPPLPGEVAQYGAEVARRLLVRPGITGLWQVSGRSNLSWDDSVRLDLYYVENWSLSLDLMIVWKTFFAIFRKEGAF
ncbi:MAG: sugar transferase [Frankiaceae bacterium]|nr:sugar transferase [Frankiaceae bacterium]MBV9871484.1 sugar transferase [Frankiaceae bacterium]